jgi:hypothetical protein
MHQCIFGGNTTGAGPMTARLRNGAPAANPIQVGSGRH